MPDTWIDTDGKARCWSCGAKWTKAHPKQCKAACDDGDQYPTTRIGTFVNVYGYTVTNKG